MFPATLKAKNLKAAMEEAKVERRARGRDRTWLNAKMALRGGPVAAPGDPLQRTLRLEFKNVRLLESGRKSCDYDSLPNQSLGLREASPEMASFDLNLGSLT